MSSPSISARRTTGMPRSRAAATSGLASPIAEEMTSRSAERTCDGSWPIEILAPSFSRRAVFSDRAASQPVISSGVASRRISAMPLMPTPPAPTKWMRRSLRNLTGDTSASKTIRARSRAALGRARVRARWLIWTRRSRFSKSSEIVPARFSAVSSGSRISTARPPSSGRRAFSSWWPEAEAPKGTRIAGRPAADSSATVIAPGPGEDEVRPGHLLVQASGGTGPGSSSSGRAGIGRASRPGPCRRTDGRPRCPTSPAGRRCAPWPG